MAEAAETRGECALSAMRMKNPGMGEPRTRVPLRGELETWDDMESLATGFSRKLQMGKPGRGPGTGRVEHGPPHFKDEPQAGWHIGYWKSDRRPCLYHPQTRTAISLVTGDDRGQFGLLWTADDEPMALDIDNVDFCVDPITVTWKDRLNDAELEAAIGDKLRLVLAGNKPPDPSQKLNFKPATIYMDTSTMQQVAIVGSSEHSNSKKIKHILVAQVTEDRAANIDTITKAKKENLMRETGRHRYCNVDKLLADIRSVYFPSFATSPQEIMRTLGAYAADVSSGTVNSRGNRERGALPRYQDGPRYIPFTAAFHNTIRQQGLNRETERMSTFATWPPSSPVPPKSLVQAGFFSIGKELYVQCFVCGDVKGTWKYGDDPLQCHYDMNGWCEFVLSYDVGNVSLEEESALVVRSEHEVFGTLPTVQAGPVAFDPSTEQQLLKEMHQECEKLSCKICMDGEIAYAFFPCGHVVVCSKCVNNGYKFCPMCRQVINRTDRVYFN
ncbi:Baculoviral IAP repeat-containing protein 2 [Branchiostoma belcheri]|nr:Baculoviral IAP repeat-containing protein 2 [Branchiostoma belcheri]